MSTRDTPLLQQDYGLLAEQIDEYRKNGHILLRGVMPPEELDSYRTAIEAVVHRRNRELRPLAERDTYGKAFLQITNLWQDDDTVRRFVLARRFAHIAAELMGVAGVRIYHDQALFKEPGGGFTPWHQDQTYWPLATDRTITMWMPLVDIPAEVGSMTFVSGTQQHGWITKDVISDNSQTFFEQYIALRGLEQVTHGAMKAGDATFHGGWTLHSAPGNPTDRMREVMTVIYMADGARISELGSPNQQADLDAWFPGRKPGDLAASPLTPLVYPA